MCMLVALTEKTKVSHFAFTTVCLMSTAVFKSLTQSTPTRISGLNYNISLFSALRAEKRDAGGVY